MKTHIGGHTLEGFEAGWVLRSLRDSGTVRTEGYPGGLSDGLRMAADGDAAVLALADLVARSRAAVVRVADRQPPIADGTLGRVRFRHVDTASDQVPSYYTVQVQQPDVAVTESLIALSKNLGHAFDHQVGDVLDGKWKTVRYPASLGQVLAFAMDEPFRTDDGEQDAAAMAVSYEASARSMLAYLGVTAEAADREISEPATTQVPDDDPEASVAAASDDWGTDDVEGGDGDEAPAELLDADFEPIVLAPGVELVRGSDGDWFVRGDISRLSHLDAEELPESGEDMLERLSERGRSHILERFSHIPRIGEMG